jgi:hypothetical protein
MLPAPLSPGLPLLSWLVAVKENNSSKWEVICGLREGDVFFDLELHGRDDEVTAAWGTGSIVEWEHMLGKFFSKGVCYVLVCSTSFLSLI